jgi:uncharacterized protein (DUF2141 family)
MAHSASKNVKNVPWVLPASVAVMMLSGWPSAATADATKTGTLTVEVRGLRSDDGHVLVQLANSEADYNEDHSAFRSAEVESAQRAAIIVFAELPYGEYAVKVFQDANDNRALDMGLMGPKESYGFSNNVMGMLGPPSYGKAKFTFSVPALTITIDTR